MAIFGFNLTLTLIGVFFLRKLIPILNLPPRFLKGFYRFLPPSEQMLRDTNNQPAKKTLGNVKKRKNQEPEKKDFVVNKVNPAHWPMVQRYSDLKSLINSERLKFNFRMQRYHFISHQLNQLIFPSFIFTKNIVG